MGQRNPNLFRSVRLFESGWKTSDIAKKLQVTKQAISVMLRKYYLNLDPPRLIDHNVTKTCKVCGCEEHTTIDQIPITSLKQLRPHPIEEKISYVCPLCKELKVHKCTSCGSVGYLEGGKFIKKPLNKENQRGRCLDCNKTNTEVWRKKNRGRAREIFGKYKRNLKQRRRNQGLCTECGRPNNTPEFSLCQACRGKHREKARISRQG